MSEFALTNIQNDLTEQNNFYSSLIPKDKKEETILFNAINNPDYKISDFINTEILVQDVICEMVQCTNKETGEVSSLPRIILITPDNETYQAVSIGIYNSMKKVFAIKGLPETWTEPIKIKIQQVTRGERKCSLLCLFKSYRQYL